MYMYVKVTSTRHQYGISWNYNSLRRLSQARVHEKKDPNTKKKLLSLKQRQTIKTFTSSILLYICFKR